MTQTEWLLDGSLGALVLALAMAVLYARTLYTSVVLYIVFGLLLALIWARLGAPDLALAEAAIGAGLTGVLLLSALTRSSPEKPIHRPIPQQGLAMLFSLAVFGLLIVAVLPLPDGHQPLPDLAQAALDDSGVSHPVTAVLLNFRAWDTLLELVVVLFALLGVRQLTQAPKPAPDAWPLLRAWGRVLAPLTVLVGGYLLWRGSTGPGGAFQGGAILAAGGVVLRLTHVMPSLSWQNWIIRLLVLMGVGIFLLVGLATHLWGNGFMAYPAGWSYALIIFIEVAATLSIAATLTLLVVGEPEELRA